LDGPGVTHEYTLLVGGTVLPGEGHEPVTAIAWAAGVVLALGSDADVVAISRGDSVRVDLGGAFVVPLGTRDEPAWPSEAALEIGGPADLAILGADPRAQAGPAPPILAVLRDGHVTRGRLPGAPH
jgi:hypothetical protein